MPKLAHSQAVVAAPVESLTPKVLTSAKVEALLADFELTQTKLQQLNAKKTALTKDLIALAVRHGKVFQAGDLVATCVASKNVSIDKQKLVELGVKATIIEQATRETPYSYMQVKRKKPEAEEVL